MIEVIRLRSLENGIVAEPGTFDKRGENVLRRIRQQEILTELGLSALKGLPFQKLMEECVRLTAEGLEVEFCKVLEYLPDEGRFRVTAGIGWGPGVVGQATVGADLASPAGYALKTGKPVISNHLENEERFRTPDLLVQYGIHRAMNVILQGEGKAFGVLEVDSRTEGEFSVNDIIFLQGIANLVGMAIERQRLEQQLTDSLERHKTLLKEVHHRVNNSLQLVTTMLHLQSQASGAPEVRRQLEEASSRIIAVARAHRTLYQTENYDFLDIRAYLSAVCKELNEAYPSCEIRVSGEPAVYLPLDKAITTALLVTELVTNAAKYAYPERKGEIEIAVGPQADPTVIRVRDWGDGLPAGFELAPGAGLGMRIILAFQAQLNAELDFIRHGPGSEFVLKIPKG